MGRFDPMPERHDGTKRITAKVTFSEPIDASEEEMSEHGVQVEGGRVRSARRAPADGNGEDAGTGTAKSAGTAKSTGTARTPKDETATPSGEDSCGEPGSTCTEDGTEDGKTVWELEIEPDSDGDVTVRIDGGRPCDEPGAVCTADGRSLSEGISTTVAGPEPGLAPLTATFPESVYASAQHKGPSDRPQVVVAFSAPVAAFGADTPSVSATGASVDVVQRLDKEGLENAYVFFLTPEGHQAIVFQLHANRACPDGGICTADRRRLSNSPSATVAGLADEPEPNTAAAGAPAIVGTPRVGEELTASTSGISDADGLDNASFAYQWIRTGVDIGGASASTYTPVAADEGERLKVRVGFTDDAGHEESLTSAGTDAVAGAASTVEPLTARFARAPAEHDGKTAFKLRIRFSEDISISFRRFRDQVLSVSGGSVKKAKRVDRRKDLWEVTVKPGSLGDVTVRLEGGHACGTAGAVCTGDGRALSATISTTVLGPVALSAADARVREASDATLDFAVTLSRASSARVAVAYATADGSATAGSDYTARKGELRFAPGETEKTVSVAVLDDAHDEGEETLTLRLSAATGAVIADGVATGTIENTDHMPAAWLARFGRTVTDQVLEAVEARLAAPRAAGGWARLAGQALPSWDGGNDNAKTAAGDNARDNASDLALAARDREAMAALRDWMAHGGANDEWRGDVSDGRVQSRGLTGRDFVTGTSFALTGGSAEAGGYAALWGRGAISRFDGREGDLTLDGEVTTGLMGADWAAERWTAGLALGHARGTGGYREGGNCEPEANDASNPGYRGPSRCAGEVEATLTGVWPYAGLTLTDRLSAWAAAGYGAGELKLTPGGESPFTADLTMAMGAAGMRGEVLTPPPDGGLALALKGDARFTRTASEATKDAAGVGNLAAATADVWLVRTGIEGSRRFAPGGGAAGLVLTPSFEIGVRLDGGDAETGLGVDLGGGLAFAAPKQGIALDLKARGLVAHQAPGFREWGASASLAWDPRPSTDRGLALTLRQSWGGSPSRRHGRAAGPRDPGRPRCQRQRRHDREHGPSGGGAGLRHRDVRRRLHRHAASRRRAHGDRARLPARLAPDLGAARRSGLRDQPRSAPAARPPTPMPSTASRSAAYDPLVTAAGGGAASGRGSWWRHGDGRRCARMAVPEAQ